MGRGHSILRNTDFVRTIEAIYAIDGTASQWLERVLRSCQAWFDWGGGLHAYTWSVSATGVATFGEFVNVGGPDTSLVDLASMAPPEMGRIAASVLRKIGCGLSSQVLPTRESSEFFHQPLRPFGIADTIGIASRDPDDVGVLLIAHLRRPRSVAAGILRLYKRLARHLAAGHRLRRRLDGRSPTDSDAVAILTAGGRLEHATRDAAKATARAALREAVLAMDRARGAERRADPEGAVRRWRVLADARFSLIDRFESNGRRYVVACENEPAPGAAARLTARERQVVALYRLGADSKLIAYELGISDATVRVLLSRAARRLGAARPRALRSTSEG